MKPEMPAYLLPPDEREKRRRTMRSQRSFALWFSLFILILIANAFFSYRSTYALIENTDRVARSHEAIGELETLLSLIKDAETGERGYIITNDEQYLEPYNIALAQIDDQFKRLKELFAENPPQLARIPQLETIFRNELDELSQTVAVNRTQGQEAARAIVKTNRGKTEMDELRQFVASMERDESANLSRLEAESRQSGRRTLYTFSLVSFLALLLISAVYLLLHRDLNRRQLSEETLRSSEERLQLAIDAAKMGAWEYFPRAGELHWSERHKELFGLPPEAEINYEIFLNGLHADDREQTNRAFQNALDPRADGKLSIEYRAVGLNDGIERWIEAKGRAFFDAHGRAVRLIGTAIDITERKRAEEELRAANELLEARVKHRTTELIEINAALNTEIAERKRAEEKLQLFTEELERSNRELQDFAFVASHDLQEPLRKIQAFGDRLKTKYSLALTVEGSDYVDRMQNAARRMHVLINDLLMYSRVTTKGQPFAVVNLNEIVREVLNDLEVRLLETGGRVELNHLPVLEADALQMRQLFQNLIGNALKFHRPGVPPVVSINRRIINASNNDAAIGETCEFMIQDNGIGFDEKYLDRIFTPFQRLHARGEYEGTGMGLAVCRKIIERHGGGITARSTPEQGTTFVFTLPIKQNAGVNRG